MTTALLAFVFLGATYWAWTLHRSANPPSRTKGKIVWQAARKE